MSDGPKYELHDLDQEEQHYLARATAAKDFLWKLAPGLLNMEPHMEHCKVCNQSREMDIVAHGPGVCVVMFYPCMHKEKTSGKVVTYYDADGNEIDINENK